MRRILQSLMVCSVPLSFGSANAATISAFKLDKGGTALVLSGDIQPGDGAKFRAEASKFNDGFVLLDSNGGSLGEAIDIGETIRLKGYATAVINDASCNSACALIWLAGSPRALSKSGRVGFHAAYSDASGVARESGVANAMVGRYLTLLNLPEKALVFATSAPPSKLSWLTSTNYGTTGIDVTVIDDLKLDESITPAAQAKGAPPPIQTVTTAPATDDKKAPVWRTVGNWTIAVDPTLQNGCFMFGSWKNETVLRVGVDRRVRNGFYVLFSNPDWKSLRLGQTFDVQFQFDARSPWKVPANVVDMGDNSYFLHATFDDTNFWNEFSASTELFVTRDGKPVTEVVLTGAKAAFDELVSCQKAQDTRASHRDPFAD